MRMRNNEHRKAGVKKGRAPEESSNKFQQYWDVCVRSAQHEVLPPEMTNNTNTQVDIRIRNIKR